MQFTQKQLPAIVQNIRAKWGESLEKLSYEQKIIMRAALAGYIADKPVWQSEGSSISCIDGCIESAGVDWGVWDDEELVEAIQDISYSLDEEEIEDFIALLTTQIKNKVYASRTKESEAVYLQQ